VDEPNPTARALLCLQLLQERPGITADRLGTKLGVSSRAARRYVAILREAGIPVESVRGPYGGYRLGRGLRLPPLVFSATEALALVMAVLDGHHPASDPADPVGSALGKIVRALPEPVATQAERVRQAAAPAPDRAAARPDLETTAALVEACSGQRLVRMGYRSEAGSEWVMEVEPWALVVRHGRWYLLCRSLKADAVRAYRVDRVRDVRILDRGFSPPAELDAVAMLEEHLAVGWEYEVEVVIDVAADRLRGWLPRVLGRLEATDDSACRLVGSTSNPTWYAEQLAVIPAPFRVVRGTEVQEAVRVLGRRLVAAGEDGGPGDPGAAGGR
jgi:predicted DNA-binding transcriptional regulator YafY